MRRVTSLAVATIILVSFGSATAQDPPPFKAPPAFEAVIKYVEAHGKPTEIRRKSCLMYCDAAPDGADFCNVKSTAFEDGNTYRSFVVFIDDDRGEAHVILYHKDNTTGEIAIYGLTRDGQLRKAVTRKDRDYSPVDLAQAEKDDSEKGYKALVRYWVGKQPELKP
jgi:hypothetical protein